MMATVAVIGGTGMNEWPGLEVMERRALLTPYGPTSAPLLFGRLPGMAAGTQVVFLARHGEGHKLPPHGINYRANLRGLYDAGVRSVIAIAAVGGIAEWMGPAAVAVPDDVIDYTYGREHTYSDGGTGSALHHVEMGEPYGRQARRALIDAAAIAGVAVMAGGVLGVTQGPRLETPAEVRRLQRDGCDMVGMTGMPETALARELGLEYACLAVSVNWAAGLSSGAIHDEIVQSIAQGMAKVHRILAAALPGLAT